jgi:thermostable 8-oxoguanine DNA glycosylase
MKTEDLIFAAQIRELAAELRQQHAYSTKKELDARLPAEQHESLEDFLLKYRLAHPIAKFVPEAMQKLEKVHEVIEQYRKASPKP